MAKTISYVDENILLNRFLFLLALDNMEQNSYIRQTAVCVCM